MLKENKGITLIALVITIIVLLILAGVSIAMIGEDEGILKKAQEAKSKTGKLYDATNFAVGQLHMKKDGSYTYAKDTFEKAIEENYDYDAAETAATKKVTVTEDDGFDSTANSGTVTVTASDSTEKITVTVRNGKITSVVSVD